MSAKNTVDKDQQRYTNLQLLKDLFVFFKPYRGRLVVASVARFVSDVHSLFPAYALAEIVNFFSGWRAGDPLTHFWILVGLWGTIMVSRRIFQYTAKMIGFRVSERAVLDAQLATIRHLFALDTAWHEKENAGNKLKRLQRGSDGIDKLTRIWFNNLIEIAVTFVGVVVIMAIFDPVISVVFVIYVPVYFLIATVLLRPATQAAKAVNAKEEELTGLYFEGLNNIRSTKVLGMTNSLLERMKVGVDEVYQKIRSRVNWFQSRNFVLGLWGEGFRIVGLVFIANGIIHGNYAVGILILFNGYYGPIAEAVRELADVSQDMIVSKFAIGRMTEILHEPIESDDETGKQNFPEDWQKLVVKNLSFDYGGRSVLKNLSFEINRGERIGVVGLSGAGKSTLFKLLLKENEHYTGKIMFDDVSLREVKKSMYYKQAAVVLQETEVFNFSLKDNITITSSAPLKNKALLDRALETAHVTDFLKRLPDGVQTLIGEKGVKLSGGERQRVGIARAIYKQPELLFLDEATSHLDLESEEKIQDSLHKFFQNVTAVVIAHRLTTIKEMDRILVLEDGRLIESGTFDELYRRKGRFFELWEKQKLN